SGSISSHSSSLTSHGLGRDMPCSSLVRTTASPHALPHRPQSETTPNGALSLATRRLAAEARRAGDAAQFLETLRGLADLYCQGYGREFGELFEETPALVPLPGYPFTARRFWIDGGARPSPAEEGEPVAASRAPEPAPTPPEPAVAAGPLRL